MRLRFPNAYKGMKKLRISTALSLAGTIITLFAYILAASAKTPFDTGLGLAGLLVLAAFVIYIVSFVLMIIGIIKAKKDEPIFGKALAYLIIVIVLYVIGVLLNTIQNFIQVISSLLELCITLEILNAIISLSVDCSDAETETKTANFKKLMVGLYVVSLLFGICKMFSGANGSGSTFFVIITLLTAVADIVLYAFYYKLLKRAEQMLMIACYPKPDTAKEE